MNLINMTPYPASFSVLSDARGGDVLVVAVKVTVDGRGSPSTDPSPVVTADRFDDRGMLGDRSAKPGCVGQESMPRLERKSAAQRRSFLNAAGVICSRSSPKALRWVPSLSNAHAR